MADIFGPSFATLKGRNIIYNEIVPSNVRKARAVATIKANGAPSPTDFPCPEKFKHRNK